MLLTLFPILAFDHDRLLLNSAQLSSACSDASSSYSSFSVSMELSSRTAVVSPVSLVGAELECDCVGIGDGGIVWLAAPSSPRRKSSPMELVLAAVVGAGGGDTAGEFAAGGSGGKSAAGLLSSRSARFCQIDCTILPFVNSSTHGRRAKCASSSFGTDASSGWQRTRARTHTHRTIHQSQFAVRNGSLCFMLPHQVIVLLDRDHAERVEEARVVDAALALLLRFDED